MVYFRDIGIVHIHEPDAFDVFNSLTEGVLCHECQISHDS